MLWTAGVQQYSGLQESSRTTRSAVLQSLQRLPTVKKPANFCQLGGAESCLCPVGTQQIDNGCQTQLGVAVAQRRVYELCGA
jgi:hypothetical protein